MSNCIDPCTCHDLAAPQRNHFFYGKLLDERSLLQEQQYLNQKRWMLNRLNLGMGVVCGLTVTSTADRLCISPGVAIDGCGREIVVPDPVEVNPWQTTDDHGMWVTPPLPTAGTHEVYLCLAYVECPTDFTPVLVTDCTRPNGTAPSMIVEKYAILVRPVAPGLPPALPPALDPKLCTALSAADDETKRREVCSILTTRACADGDSTSCVTIVSKVTLTDGKITTVDVCSARPVVYSNPELFEMLLCRGGGGGTVTVGPEGPRGPEGPQGLGIDGVKEAISLDCKAKPTVAIDDKSVKDKRFLEFGIPRGCDGKDGLGLYPNLPKILDIGWTHDALYEYRTRIASSPDTEPSYNWVFLNPFMDEKKPRPLNMGDDKTVFVDRIIKGDNAPPFTIYFNQIVKGIDRQTFTLHFKLPLIRVVSANPLVVEPLGLYLELQIYGDILLVEIPPVLGFTPTTPHTGEEYPYAASFIPHPNVYTFLPFLLTLGAIGTQQKQLPPPTFTIRLKGDFVWTPGEKDFFKETMVLDADNIGGRVGLNEKRFPPVQGGKNPSGNLTQGGDFESWLHLNFEKVPTDDAMRPPPLTIGPRAWNAVKTHGFDVSALPVGVNFASLNELTGAGFTKIQAEAVLRERELGWFSSDQDLKTRANLSEAAFRKIRSDIIVL